MVMAKKFMNYATTLNMLFRVTNSSCLAQYYHGVVSPTLNLNPTLFAIPCKCFWHYRCPMLHLLSLTK